MLCKAGTLPSAHMCTEGKPVHQGMHKSTMMQLNLD